MGVDFSVWIMVSTLGIWPSLAPHMNSLDKIDQREVVLGPASSEEGAVNPPKAGGGHEDGHEPGNRAKQSVGEGHGYSFGAEDLGENRSVAR